MSVEGTIETHALIAIEEMQEQMGEKWGSLTEDQRTAAKRAAKRLVTLEWQQRAEGKDVSEDLAFVRSTVEGFKLAGQIALHDALWEGVKKAFEALGSFLVGAGKSLIPGLGQVATGINLAGVFNVS